MKFVEKYEFDKKDPDKWGYQRKTITKIKTHLDNIPGLKEKDLCQMTYLLDDMEEEIIQCAMKNYLNNKEKVNG
jgi:hypothetical protein|tara:strand:- start:1851 stop:2072 length:222 start_codon:yes stop_codon:yes gene_type:complete